MVFAVWSLLVPVLVPILVVALFFLLLILLRTICYRYSSSSRHNALVLCLGDVGRSPRMQYHAVSMAERMNVHVVGYTGNTGSGHRITRRGEHVHVH